MRGKLIKRDPNDEPASILLDRIEEEKAQLVKEGKIKKSKSLPPITDAEKTYKIPDSWEWVRGQEIVSSIGDGLHGTPIFSSSGIPFINGSNLLNGKISITNATKFVSNEKIVLGKSAGYYSLILADMQLYIYYFLQSSVFKQYYQKNILVLLLKIYL